MKVGIDEVTPHPKNARFGSLVEITESLEEFDQYRPLTVNKRTGFIVKGNNTWKAMKEAGRTECEVVYIDVDEKAELRILLADNRIAEIGNYDSDVLLETLTAVNSLDGTGYDENFVASLGVYDGDLFAEDFGDIDDGGDVIILDPAGPVDEPEPPLPPMVSELDLDGLPYVETVEPMDKSGDDEDIDGDWPASWDAPESYGQEDDGPKLPPEELQDDPFRSISDYKRTHLIRCGGLSAIIEPGEYQRWWDASLEEHGTVEAAGEYYRTLLELPPPCERPKVERPKADHLLTDAYDENTPVHDMDLEEVDLDELTHHPMNPRRGDVGAIATSLRKHGQYAPVIVDQDNVILAGNHTVKAARMLDWTSIAVKRLEVDEETGIRILLADNRTSDLGTNSVEGLVSLLNSVDDDISGTGFSSNEVARLLSVTQTKPVVGHKRSISQIGTPKMPFTRLLFPDFVEWKEMVQAKISDYSDAAYVEYILETIGIDPTACMTRKRREGSAV